VELRFEWDAEKARTNLTKHGVGFGEAQDVFADPLSLTIDDSEHSLDESRLLIVGVSRWGRLLVVSHTAQGDMIRLIGARRATPRERFEYEENRR
jgi:uncharacterized DUF497 family protein